MFRNIGLTIFAVATIACGHDGPVSPSSGPTLIVSEAISVPHSFDIGRTYPLKATLRNSGGAEEDVTAASQWTSSDNGVATMAGNVVRVQALGEVDVIASHGNAVGRFHISVTEGDISFQFSPQVSESDQQLIREAVASGQSNFASTFGWHPTSKVTVTVNAGPNPVVTASTSRSTVMINSGSRTWSGSSADGRRRIVLHEFFHVLQLSTGGWVELPLWLIEGAAEYVGFHAAIVDRGLAAANAVRACHEQYVETYPVAIPPLSELAAERFYDGTRGPYALAYLAADQIVADRGLASLMTFGTSVIGSGFLPAFEATYGRSLSEFYDAFEPYRHSLPHTSESVCGTWF